MGHSQSTLILYVLYSPPPKKGETSSRNLMIYMIIKKPQNFRFLLLDAENGQI